MMKKTFLLITLSLLLSVMNAARADGEQFYFVGAVAPLGSMSQQGAGNAVYLRWDVTEGNLPSDIDTFILKRDGTVIGGDAGDGVFPVTGVRNTAQIEALYAGVENARRKAEISRWLTELNEAPVSYSVEIQNKLLPGASEDKFWSLFASRIDFNVAASRYRAYVDKTATGAHTYELFVRGGAGERLVGRVQADLSSPSLLPAAGDFAQVSRFDVNSSTGLGRCDSTIERFKDHGVVALTWEPAATGANSTERYVSILMTAGFDLYRSTEQETGVPPVRDIRSLARGLSHDANGRVQIPGLVKVNDQPVVVAGNVPSDPAADFFEPAFYQHVETLAELREQGIKPGDQYSYYLVARDITGNYGQTTAINVTVPDLIAPPAPWRIDAVVDPYPGPLDDAFKLTWDHVDVLSYQLSHSRSRQWCNLETARFDKRLMFVAKGEDCETDKQSAINLDVDRYLVYRFTNAGTAGEFSDIDGDGRSDNAERLWDHDGDGDGDGTTAKVFDIRATGDACNAGANPSAAINYLADEVLASSRETLPDGRRVLKFVDAIPTSNPGLVYWYRIASKDADGFVSSLSQPIRAMAAAQTRPLRSLLDTAVLGSENCSYQVAVVATGDGVPFAEDLTGDNAAASATFSCSGAVISSALDIELEPQQCQQMDASCTTATGVVTYFTAEGLPLGATSKVGWSSCPNETKTTLVKVCDGTVTPAADSDVLTSTAMLDYEVPADHCLKIYRDVGGVSEHYKTLCAPVEPPITLDFASMGDQVCLSLALQSHDGVVSSRRRLPCITVHDVAADLPDPLPSRILEVVVQSNSNNLQIQLLPPEQPLAGSIVEWYVKGELETSEARHYSDFFPHAGQSAVTGALQLDLAMTTEQGGSEWDEQWCMRVRSVAKTRRGSPEQGLSKWTAERCVQRLPAAGIASEYLPWPSIESRPVLGRLQSRFLSSDATAVILLSQTALDLDPVQCNFNRILSCDVSGATSCLPAVNPAQPQTATCLDFCSVVQSSIPDKTGFVVYRQRASNTSDSSTFTEYLQVSPLIDRVHCKNVYGKAGDFGGTGAGASLFDPNIMLTEFTGNVFWNGLRAVYRDHYPMIAGQNYRYQLVYFDDRGEITGHRWTDWIQVN